MSRDDVGLSRIFGKKRRRGGGGSPGKGRGG